jgi:hypothetical protein
MLHSTYEAISLINPDFNCSRQHLIHVLSDSCHDSALLGDQCGLIHLMMGNPNILCATLAYTFLLLNEIASAVEGSHLFDYPTAILDDRKDGRNV